MVSDGARCCPCQVLIRNWIHHRYLSIHPGKNDAGGVVPATLQPILDMVQTVCKQNKWGTQRDWLKLRAEKTEDDEA